jgi:hypothetical protein
MWLVFSLLAGVIVAAAPFFLMAIASIIGGWVLSIEFGFALVLIFSAWSLLTDG